MATVDSTYIKALDYILRLGEYREDRTRTGTVGVFDYTMTFNLQSNTLPLLTTKKMPHKTILRELLWFLSGSTNIQYLKENNVSIWDEWATNTGEIGPMYGKQWRDWNGVDQLEVLIDGIKARPWSRRHIISAWNVDDLPDEQVSPVANVKNGKMALAPCHAFMQFHVSGIDRLNLKLTQRSADMFLGVPFNIAQYSMLLMMVAKEVGLIPGKFIWSGGDVHIYLNHINQARELMARSPLRYDNSWLVIDDEFSILTNPDFNLVHVVNYESYPPISAPISV